VLGAKFCEDFIRRNTFDLAGLDFFNATRNLGLPSRFYQSWVVFRLLLQPLYESTHESGTVVG